MLVVYSVQAQVPTQGLVAYFPFNGNAIDYSGKAGTSILYGNPLYGNDRFGNPSRAFMFDGIDDYIKVFNADNLNFYGSDFTISLWINETQRFNGLQSAIISKRNMDKSNKRVGYALSVTGDEHPWGTGKVLYQLGGGANSSAITGDSTLLSTWYHLVFTYNKTAQIGKFYINGLLNFTSAKLAPPVSNTASMYIGGDSLAFSFAKGYLFNGLLDDIRFYNRMLSDEEINDLDDAETCKNPIITELTRTVCDGDSIIAGNHYHKESGIYYDTLISLIGCDSIIKTLLIKKEKYFNSKVESICNGDSILLYTKYHKTSGYYYDSYVTSFGCDSIFETELIIKESSLTKLYDTIIKSDSILFNGSYLFNAGKYSQKFSNIKGCDSIVEFYLSIDSLTKYYTISGRIMTKDSSSISGSVELYKTSEPYNQTPYKKLLIINNTYKFTHVLKDNYILLARPDANSIYIPTYYWQKQDRASAFPIYVDGDVGKTDIYLIRKDVGIEEISDVQAFDIFPNPVIQSLVVSTKYLVNANTKIQILNSLGQIIYTNDYRLSTNYSINVSQFTSGLYYLRILNNERIVYTKKFIKK